MESVMVSIQQLCVTVNAQWSSVSQKNNKVLRLNNHCVWVLFLGQFTDYCISAISSVRDYGQQPLTPHSCPSLGLNQAISVRALMHCFLQSAAHHVDRWATNFLRALSYTLTFSQPPPPPLPTGRRFNDRWITFRISLMIFLSSCSLALRSST